MRFSVSTVEHRWVFPSRLLGQTRVLPPCLVFYWHTPFQKNREVEPIVVCSTLSPSVWRRQYGTISFTRRKVGLAPLCCRPVLFSCRALLDSHRLSSSERDPCVCTQVRHALFGLSRGLAEIESLRSAVQRQRLPDGQRSRRSHLPEPRLLAYCSPHHSELALRTSGQCHRGWSNR